MHRHSKVSCLAWCCKFGYTLICLMLWSIPYHSPVHGLWAWEPSNRGCWKYRLFCSCSCQILHNFPASFSLMPLCLWLWQYFLAVAFMVFSLQWVYMPSLELDPVLQIHLHVHNICHSDHPGDSGWLSCPCTEALHLTKLFSWSAWTIAHFSPNLSFHCSRAGLHLVSLR